MFEVYWLFIIRRKTILVEMLACLDSEENTTFLAMNPVLLQVFEEWLKPILNYSNLNIQIQNCLMMWCDVCKAENKTYLSLNLLLS